MAFFKHRRFTNLMKKTPVILDALLNGVTQEQARSMTDGPGGWNTVEIVCHLRDFETISYERVVMMLEQDNPSLPACDHEALAVDCDYAHQNLDAAFQDFITARQKFIDLFSSLTEEQWQRTGIHPESGPTTVLERAAQVVLHDIDHIEQIARVLELPQRFA